MLPPPVSLKANQIAHAGYTAILWSQVIGSVLYMIGIMK